MHSDTSYVDQTPEVLRLTLVEGELDRTQFRLLFEQDCVLADVRISAAVIGASHVVTYDTGAFRLHEIFACVGLENVSSWSLAELVRLPVVREYPGFRYEFQAEVVEWNDPEPEMLVDMVRATPRLRDAGAVGLVVEFPSRDLSVIPKTVVLGRASEDGREISFTTAHSYPNVRGLVISHSVLKST